MEKNNDELNKVLSKMMTEIIGIKAAQQAMAQVITSNMVKEPKQVVELQELINKVTAINFQRLRDELGS